MNSKACDKIHHMELFTKKNRESETINYEGSCLKERENINNALRGIHNDEGFCKKVHL
jgi:hypothetical protein